MHYPGTSRPQVAYPQIISALEGRHIIQLIPGFTQDGITQRRRIGSQAHHPVFNIFQFDLNVFLLFLIRFGIFLFILFFAFCLGCRYSFFFLFQQLIAFFIQTEFIIRILIHKDYHHVLQGPPRGVVTHSITFAGKKNGISIEHPAGIAVKITAVRQIYHFPAPVSLHDSDVAIRVMAVSDDFHGKPFPIGRPRVREAVPSAVLIFIVRHLPDFFGFQVHNHQFRAVFNERQFLPVRGELRGKTFFRGSGQHGFFLD